MCWVKYKCCCADLTWVRCGSGVVMEETNVVAQGKERFDVSNGMASRVQLYWE